MKVLAVVWCGFKTRAYGRQQIGFRARRSGFRLSPERLGA